MLKLSSQLILVFFFIPTVRNTAMDTELSPFGHHVETTEHHLGKTDKELVVIVIYKAGIYEEFIMSGA